MLFSSFTLEQGQSINLNIHPLLSDNAVYFDAIDQEGNFQTVRQPVNSVPDTAMNAVTFNSRVQAVISSGGMVFNETDFELNVFRLKNAFMAYANDVFNNQSNSVAYFKGIAESTIVYLNNYIVVDKRLDEI